MFFIFALPVMGILLVAWCAVDNRKWYRVSFCTMCAVMAVLATWGEFRNHGLFGRPCSLNHGNHYRVLNVTPISEKSTVVILHDEENDKTVPIEFHTSVTADTNGFYTAVGESDDNFNLTPIK
jgi:hypothetical protein